MTHASPGFADVEHVSVLFNIFHMTSPHRIDPPKRTRFNWHLSDHVRATENRFQLHPRSLNLQPLFHGLYDIVEACFPCCFLNKVEGGQRMSTSFYVCPRRRYVDIIVRTSSG